MADHHEADLLFPAVDELLIGSSTRSRHSIAAIRALAQPSTDA